MAAAKAEAADKEPAKKSRTSRSSSARHITMGISSARQRASGSANRRLAPPGASPVGAGAGAGQGLKTSVANDTVLRAASGKSMPSLDKVYHAVPRRLKVCA